jgi:hypothetical protein
MSVFCVITVRNWPAPWPFSDLRDGANTVVGAVSSQADVSATNVPRMKRERRRCIVASGLVGRSSVELRG